MLFEKISKNTKIHDDYRKPIGFRIFFRDGIAIEFRKLKWKKVRFTRRLLVEGGSTS